MKKSYCRLFMIFFLFHNIMLSADIHIKITEGSNDALPIGIVPFLLTNNIDINSDLISNIIRCDLNNSGKFNALDLKSLPQYPMNIKEINNLLWKSKNVGIIVIGQIELNSNHQYDISYQLINIINGSKIILLSNKYKVNKSLLRYVAHTISDKIFEKLTNIQGAFRTRIAYVTKNEEKKLPYELQVSDYDGYNNFIAYKSINPIMSPSWSKNGKEIAYVMFKKNKSFIVIQTLKTGIIRIISSYPRHNGAPSFSPDGNKLAFVLSKTGNLNIYIINLHSNNIDQITNDHFNNTEPTWFPDSQTLAYTSDQDGSPQIYQINIYSKISKRITWFSEKNQNANIAPNGKFIYMISTNNGEQHLIKQNLQTGEFYQLTNNFLDETPTVAPNGIMIIYSTSKNNFSKLQLVSSNALYKRFLLINSKNVKFPTWSSFLD